MGEFTMPSLGADMESGTLLEWLVKPGDQVHKGDIVAVVDTSKAAVEVETFTDGVVQELLVTEGTEVPVGTPLAIIGDRLDAAAPPAAPPPEPVAVPTPTPTPSPEPVTPSEPVAEASPPAPATVPTPPEPAPPHHVRVASPLARRRATELGVDLDTVVGTGRDGQVTREDVEARAHAGRPRVTPYARRLASELGVDLAAVPATGGRVRAEDVRRAAAIHHDGEPPPVLPDRRPVTPSPEDRAAGMRATIARLMTRSKREVPHYYLATTVDLDRAMTWMHAQNVERPLSERLVPAALLLKATARAAQAQPGLNGFWVEDRFVPGPGVHLGVAISLRGGGLVAPAIHDAAELDLDHLMASLKDLVARARAGRLRGSELADPTLTVTNLGDQGVDSVLGVIYPPQVALVGFGRVAERPVAVDGLLGIRPATQLTLAADHRATDGFTGARFLDAIDHLLQEPEAL